MKNKNILKNQINGNENGDIMIEDSNLLDQKKNIKFSVIVPVFNVEAYLNQCIESVISQSFPHFELILVNDGSTDSSGDICNYYCKKDKRIKVIHQSNQGHIMARMNGIKSAMGEFILFLDSDDYWDPHLLEIVNKNIIDYNCDLILFKYRKVLDNGKQIFVQETKFKSGEINKKLLFEELVSSSNLNNLCNKAIKRNLIDEIVGYEKFRHIKLGEDLLMSLPILYNAKKVIFIDKPLYYYRYVNTSITNTFKIQDFFDITQVRIEVLKFMNKVGFNDNVYLQKFYNYYINSFIIYLYNFVINEKDIINKLNMIIKTTQNNLLMEARKYEEFFKIKFDKLIIYKLFNKRYYRSMIFYIKMHNFLRKVKICLREGI